MTENKVERKVPLYDLKLSRQAIDGVAKVLKSGWLTTGSQVAAFEAALVKRIHVRNVTAVSSATAGLQATLEALGVEGKEVITSPFTFVATVEAIVRAGGSPIFADIDPATLNIDPDEVARKVTNKTSCVLPIDIAGQLADYPRLKKVCEHHKLPMIADASHSFGASLKRKTTAQWTDAAIHSFQATKNLTTGEGGCVATRHKILHARLRPMTLHALTSNAYQRREAGEWQYDVVGLGMKANLTDMQAAVGLGQLEVFDADQAKRARLAERYNQRLADFHEMLEIPYVKPGAVHAWHLYIIRLHLSHLKIDRQQFIALMKEAGIECSVHYRPVFDLAYYQQLGFKPKHYPNAEYAGRRVVSLPMFASLPLKDVDYVCDRIEEIVARYRC